MTENKFTKERKDIVYDRSKIGVGDIIEFNAYTPIVLPFMKEKVEFKRAGIVTEVSPEYVVVRTQSQFREDSRRLEDVGIPVERAEELRMIHRAHYNQKEAE